MELCVCATTPFSSNISMLAILESSLTLGSFKHCDLGILRSQSLRYQFHLVLVCFRCNVLFAKSNYWEVMQLFFIWFLDDAVDTNFESSRPASIRDLRYEEACNRIAVEAVKRGCTDNVTVMIVDIMQSPWHKELTYTALEYLLNRYPLPCLLGFSIRTHGPTSDRTH